MLSTILLYNMVNKTRIEGGGYSKHDIFTRYDIITCFFLILKLFQQHKRSKYLHQSTCVNDFSIIYTP